MTPSEQSTLPWVLRTDHDGFRLIVERVRPMLRTAAATTSGHAFGDPVCASSADPDSDALTLHAAHGDGDRSGPSTIECSITIMPECLTAIGHDPGIREGHGVAAAMLAVVERLLDGRWEHGLDDPAGLPSDDLAVFAAARMRDRMGTPFVEGEEIAVRSATPLGMGGIRVLRTSPLLDDPGTLVDASPRCCPPGAVRISYETRNVMDIVRRSVVIGRPDRIVHPRPIDPVTMLRMEAEHPWDPTRIRHETGGRP